MFPTVTATTVLARTRCAFDDRVAHGDVPKTRFSATWMIAAALLVGAGCHCADEPIVMKRIELGSGADDQGRITEPARTFEPQSTVYASIATEGTVSARLHVEWRSGGKLLASEVRDIDPDGPAQFVFHLAPPEGWPTGRAQIVFFTDERDKHAAAFEVR
jgi:hypothetical protein